MELLKEYQSDWYGILWCLSYVQVRFAALKVIEEMSRKLGDSYKVVLPETIVTLTELNEGESQCCMQLVSIVRSSHSLR